MTINIEALMCSIDKDVKLTNDDEKLLSNLTESFIANQLDEIKNVKINNVYKNVNNILILVCDKIANKFKIDKNVMNEIIESELCSINLRYNIEQQCIKKQINLDSDNESQEKIQSESDTETEEEAEEEEEKEVQTCTTCQVFIEKKGQICGRLKKAGTNYCGYHKNHSQ